MTTVDLKRELNAERELASALADYAGQWVAVRQHSVEAHADSLEGVLDQIGEEEATAFDGIFRVPEADTACYF